GFFFRLFVLHYLFGFGVANYSFFCLNLARNIPATECHDAAKRKKRKHWQARYNSQQPHEHGGDHKGTRISAELIDNSLVCRTISTPTRNEKARSKRYDKRWDLRNNTVANREFNEDICRFAKLHTVTEITNDNAAEDVDR